MAGMRVGCGAQGARSIPRCTWPGYLTLLLVIAVHDARTLRAPNRIVYPALGFTVLASLTLGWRDTREALLGGLAAFILLLVIYIVGRGKMGAADVKVGTLCGIVVGLHGMVPLLFVTFIASAAIALALLLLGIRKRSDVIAFTSFLVGATVFSMVYYDLYLWS